MDKDHFCYELFNFKENLFHDRHRYFSFLFFFFNDSMKFLLQESYITCVNVPAESQQTKRTRNLAGEAHSNRILSIRVTHTYILTIFRSIYLTFLYTLYIYFTLCFGKSLALYLPCHRTLHPPSNFYKTSVKLFLSFDRGRTNFRDSNGDSCWSRD